ncbi:hypothetical protein F5Y07DRAFT_398246 [Xylaria sp. FL0933]|nr:hypothetical protein F5Y07DRAFT_398246 [Xylaria sp. FL0933]
MSPFGIEPSVTEVPTSGGNASVSDETTSASSHEEIYTQVSSDGRQMDRASQRLEVPPIQTRPRSISDGASRTRSFSTHLQPPLISSDDSESENDIFSHHQGPVQSTEATSSLGQASPLLTADDENHQVTGPEPLLLDVQHDRTISGSHHLEEDDASLVELSAGYHSPCDDRSLKIAKDSIRGSEITGDIPRRTIREPTHRQWGTSTAQINCDGILSSSDSEPDDSDLSTSKVITLHDRIWDCMIKTPTSQKFLPNGSLDLLITRDTVEAELRRAFTRDKPRWDKAKLEKRTRRLVERICIRDAPDDGRHPQPIRQIFTILVLIDMASRISSFIDAGLSDYDLPLSPTKDEEQQIHPKRRRNASRKPPLEDIPHFQQWLPGRKWDFWEWQWRVIAPVLIEGDYNDVQLLHLHENDILPFVICEGNSREDVGSGGFGVVYKARIHPDHYKFNDKLLSERGFAIKQIDQVKRESFDQERNILKKFKGVRSHPHVVSLLSTFEQGSKLGLIFYRADGDLRAFWKSKNPRPQIDRKTSIWAAKQCAGLASALLRLHNHETFNRLSVDTGDGGQVPDPKRKVKIAVACKHARGTRKPKLQREKHSATTVKRDTRHSDSETLNECEQRAASTADQQVAELRKVRKYGRHGDIKPENILWYSDLTDDLGTLQLTDFGVSDLKSGMSKSEIQSNLAGTLVYRAPEFDVPERVIRQSADIWSLGCVFVEFITWLLGGEPLLRQFSRKRMSWDPYAHMEMDTFFESDCVKHLSGKTIKLKVKDSVISFFDELHEHVNCTEYIHDFLDLIRDSMLVLETDDTSESNRILAAHLFSQLNRFEERCRDEEMYATERQKRKAKPLDARKTYVEIEIFKEDSSPNEAALLNGVFSAMQKPGVYMRLQDHGVKDVPQTH